MIDLIFYEIFFLNVPLLSFNPPETTILPSNTTHETNRFATFISAISLHFLLVVLNATQKVFSLLKCSPIK